MLWIIIYLNQQDNIPSIIPTEYKVRSDEPVIKQDKHPVTGIKEGFAVGDTLQQTPISHLFVSSMTSTYCNKETQSKPAIKERE